MTSPIYRTLYPDHVYILCEPFLLFQGTGPQRIQSIISQYASHTCEFSIILCRDAYNLLIEKHSSVCNQCNFLIVDSHSFSDFARVLRAIKPSNHTILYTHTILDHNYGLVMRLVQKVSVNFTTILYDGGCGKTHAQNYVMASKLQHWWRLNILKNRYTVIPLWGLKIYSVYCYDFLYTIKVLLTVYFGNKLLPYLPPLNSTFQNQLFLSRLLTFCKPYLICQTQNAYHALQLLELGCDEVHCSLSASNKLPLQLVTLQLDVIEASQILTIILCPSYKYLELLLLDQPSMYSLIRKKWNQYIFCLIKHFKDLTTMHITLHPSAINADYYRSIFEDIASSNSVINLHHSNASFHSILDKTDLVIGETSSALVYSQSANIPTYSINPLNNPEVNIFCSTHDIKLISL